MTSRDEERLIWQLTVGAEAAVRLRNHVHDLHSLAWERHVGDYEHVNGGADHPGVETTGDLRARTLWNRLCTTATDLDTLLPLERAIGNFFSAGPSPEGSSHPLVSKGDWARQLKARDRRRARGEFTPVRIEDQPPYGGGAR